MSSLDSRFCGIDLGTTNSCIAVLDEKGARVLELDGQVTMPSVVAWKDGQWLTGQAARNHLAVSPKDAVSSIKRKMDDAGYRIELGGESLSPIDVSAKILNALVRGAEQQLDCTIDKAVITVPAWFQEQQRQATLEAGRQAGLEVLQIVNEPTAAAIAHERISLDDSAEERWLVYDLGGGTFDVSLLNVSAASYEVLASEGNTFLGGDDFDHRLVEQFVTHLRNQHNIDAGSDILAKARLRLLAENTKIQLSNSTHVHLLEPIVISDQNMMLDLELTREDFEDLIGDLIDSTLEKVAQVMTDSNIGPESVDRLLLVGGSTRIPLIGDKLKQRFGIDAENWLDADLSVATGACIRAAICCGQIFDRSVVDICPHSLGIAAMGEEDYKEMDLLGNGTPDSHHPLTFVPLIRRNTRLPANFMRTFYKAHEHQRGANMPVYQGEHSNTRHNNFIGEFFVEFSQHHSDKLDVRFRYDLNGTIKITIIEGDNGTERDYSMSLSHSAEENSEFHALDDDGETALIEANKEDESAVTNFLIEKASQKLELSEEPAPEITRLLERYQSLLEKEEADDELDKLEEKLYDWVDSE